MHTIELKKRTDKQGRLKINYNFNQPEKNVRVILLSDETSEKEEKIWEETVLKDPVFDFLKDPSEDIYTMNDGEEINA